MPRTISKDKTSRDRGITKISLSWHYEDIISRAEHLNIRIPTKKEAREILYNIQDEHNKDTGVNWDVVDCCTEQYFRNNR